MSTEKKHTAFGVDAEKQKVEPTLVEKAQEAEAKAKGGTNGALSTPEEIDKVLVDSTHFHQKYIDRTPKVTGENRLETVLHNQGKV